MAVWRHDGVSWHIDLIKRRCAYNSHHSSLPFCEAKGVSDFWWNVNEIAFLESCVEALSCFDILEEKMNCQSRRDQEKLLGFKVIMIAQGIAVGDCETLGATNDEAR